MKDGIDKGYDKRADRITKLEDSANLKAVILSVSREIMPGLTSKYRLSTDDWNELDADLEKAFTNSIINRPSSLRELAVETIRDTMRRRGINAPGFRDEYLEELEARMKVRIE